MECWHEAVPLFATTKHWPQKYSINSAQNDYQNALFKSMFLAFQSADMSPASSTTSLPVSPLTEEPVPFKVKIKQQALYMLFV